MTQVIDMKPEEKVEAKPAGTRIDSGNIGVLTIQLLDAINRNIITLTKQNAEILSLLEDVKANE